MGTASLAVSNVVALRLQEVAQSTRDRNVWDNRFANWELARPYYLHLGSGKLIDARCKIKTHRCRRTFQDHRNKARSASRLQQHVAIDGWELQRGESRGA